MSTPCSCPYHWHRIGSSSRALVAQCHMDEQIQLYHGMSCTNLCQCLKTCLIEHMSTQGSLATQLSREGAELREKLEERNKATHVRTHTSKYICRHMPVSDHMSESRNLTSKRRSLQRYCSSVQHCERRSSLQSHVCGHAYGHMPPGFHSFVTVQ